MACRSCRNQNTSNATAANSRAESAYLQKLTDLAKAIKVNPNDAEAHNAIAELLMSKGNYTGAKDFLHRAIQRDKELSQPHYNMGVIYLMEERYTGAKEEFEAALKLSHDDASIHHRLGQARAGLGFKDEALTEFDEAIQLDEEYTPGYIEKAKLLYTLQRFSEGADVLRTALQHIPPYIPPQAIKKEKTSGVSIIDSLIPGQTVTEDDERRPTFKEEAAFDLALCLKAQGSYGEALSALANADTVEDAKPDVGLLRARIQEAMNDYGGAIGTLSLLRTSFPEMAEIPKLMARYYERSGNSDLAMKTRLEAAELDHSDKPLQIEAAQAAETRRDRPRMIAVYERICRIDPDDIHFRIKLAQAYDDIHIRREAAIAWQEVIYARDRLAEEAKTDPDRAARSPSARTTMKSAAARACCSPTCPGSRARPCCSSSTASKQ